MGILVACVLALSISTASAAPDDECKGKKSQRPPECDSEEPPATQNEYLVQLTLGGFSFGDAVPVTLNSRGNELYDGGALDMARPDDLVDQSAWDSVFDVCANLLADGLGDVLIDSIIVPDNWTINKSGEGDIRIRLRDILLNGADVQVELIGVPGSHFLPADSDNPEVFVLDEFVIYGRSVKGGPGGSQGCQASGGGSADNHPLIPYSELTIYLPSTP